MGTTPWKAEIGMDNLTNPSMVLAEQILTIDKSRVIKCLGEASDEQIKRIDEAIMVSLGLSK